MATISTFVPAAAQATKSEAVAGTQHAIRRQSIADVADVAFEQARLYGPLLYRLQSAWPLDETGTDTRFDRIAATGAHLIPDTVTDESGNNGSGFASPASRLYTTRQMVPGYASGAAASTAPFTAAVQYKSENSDTSSRLVIGQWNAQTDNSRGWAIVHTSGPVCRMNFSSDGATTDVSTTGASVSDGTYNTAVLRYFGDGTAANGLGVSLRVNGVDDHDDYTAGGVWRESEIEIGNGAAFNTTTNTTDFIIRSAYIWDYALPDDLCVLLENGGLWTNLW